MEGPQGMCDLPLRRPLHAPADPRARPRAQVEWGTATGAYTVNATGTARSYIEVRMHSRRLRARHGSPAR